MSVRQQVQQALRDQRRAKSNRPIMLPISFPVWSPTLPLTTDAIICSLIVTFLNDLIDGDWMVRHGGALGLKSLSPLSLPQVPIYCLLVLILDTFADYSQPGVVAPVRETVAQVLALSQHAPSHLPTLLTLTQFKFPALDEWSVRLSGFVSLKYLLLAKHELAPLQLQDIIQQCLLTIADETSDDVRAVAASVLRLIPSSLLPASKFSPILSNTLDRLFETSPSAASLIMLANSLKVELDIQVLRTFLGHADPKARCAVVQAPNCPLQLLLETSVLDPDEHVRQQVSLVRLGSELTVQAICDFLQTLSSSSATQVERGLLCRVKFDNGSVAWERAANVLSRAAELNPNVALALTQQSACLGMRLSHKFLVTWCLAQCAIDGRVYISKTHCDLLYHNLDSVTNRPLDAKINDGPTVIICPIDTLMIPLPENWSANIVQPLVPGEYCPAALFLTSHHAHSPFVKASLLDARSIQVCVV